MELSMPLETNGNTFPHQDSASNGCDNLTKKSIDNQIAIDSSIKTQIQDTIAKPNDEMVPNGGPDNKDKVNDDKSHEPTQHNVAIKAGASPPTEHKQHLHLPLRKRHLLASSTATAHVQDSETDHTHSPPTEHQESQQLHTTDRKPTELTTNIEHKEPPEPPEQNDHLKTSQQLFHKLNTPTNELKHEPHDTQLNNLNESSSPKVPHERKHTPKEEHTTDIHPSSHPNSHPLPSHSRPPQSHSHSHSTTHNSFQNSHQSNHSPHSHQSHQSSHQSHQSSHQNQHSHYSHQSQHPHQPQHYQQTHFQHSQPPHSRQYTTSHSPTTSSSSRTQSPTTSSSNRTQSPTRPPISPPRTHSPTTPSHRLSSGRGRGAGRGRGKSSKVESSSHHSSGHEEVYCFCRRAYDPTVDVFMICCDECDEWYHGSCVGVNQREAKKIARYVCPRCKKIPIPPPSSLSEVSDDDEPVSPPSSSSSLSAKSKKRKNESAFKTEPKRQAVSPSLSDNGVEQEVGASASSSRSNNNINNNNNNNSSNNSSNNISNNSGRECLNCTRVAQERSKYCSVECGLQFARKQYHGSSNPASASSNGKKPITATEMADKEALDEISRKKADIAEKLTKLAKEQADLDKAIQIVRSAASPASRPTSPTVPAETDDVKHNSIPSSENTTIDCASCGHPIANKSLAQLEASEHAVRHRMSRRSTAEPTARHHREVHKTIEEA